MKLLHIMASPRGDHSRTLDLANELIEGLRSKNPGLEVSELNVFDTDLPEVMGNAVDAKYYQMGGVTLEGDLQVAWDQVTAFCDQFLANDVIVISTPMWNFTVPYRLKHYIDVIMQPGKLFAFTPTGIQGLATGKKMYCVSTAGGDYSAEGPMHQFDLLDPYIRSIFGLAGVFDISFVRAQPLDMDPNQGQVSLAAAKEAARELAGA